MADGSKLYNFGVNRDTNTYSFYLTGDPETCEFREYCPIYVGVTLETAHKIIKKTGLVDSVVLFEANTEDAYHFLCSCPDLSFRVFFLRDMIPEKLVCEYLCNVQIVEIYFSFMYSRIEVLHHSFMKNLNCFAENLSPTVHTLNIALCCMAYPDIFYGSLIDINIPASVRNIMMSVWCTSSRINRAGADLFSRDKFGFLLETENIYLNIYGAKYKHGKDIDKCIIDYRSREHC